MERSVLSLRLTSWPAYNEPNRVVPVAEDYYDLLGVDPDASEDAILRAYRERAAEEHPDVSDDEDADDTFRRLSEAKDVLTNPDRRREYDRVGHDRFVDQDEGSGSARGDRTTADPTADRHRTGWPDGVGTLLQHLFGVPNPRGSAGGPARWSGQSAAGRTGVDLRGLFQGPSPFGTGDRISREGDRANGTGTDAAERCPECKGRGRFLHIIDTARGRTRRVERCDRCGGSGSLSSEPGN